MSSDYQGHSATERARETGLRARGLAAELLNGFDISRGGSY